jgi:hypothetical protein
MGETGPSPGPRSNRSGVARRLGGTWFVCRVAYGRHPQGSTERDRGTTASLRLEGVLGLVVVNRRRDAPADVRVEAVAGEQRVGTLAALAGVGDP